ncbi:MAG: hypothetical protein HYU28_03840 [Actinobacteria bacterium]|nr:hypothetical protein [Actinomycetota bacterium]
MSTEFFEQVADAVVGLVPPDLGPPSTRLTAINFKVWFGPQATGQEGREHYEIQLLRDGSVEIGFHSEHRSAEQNDAVLERLLAHEREWRKALGPNATPGPFLGREEGPWRRLSDVGPMPRPFDVESALVLAERLTTYVEALEPFRLA